MSTQPENRVVRVDFYKPSGKWYMTENLDMTDFYDHGSSSTDAVRAALKAADLVRPSFITVVADPHSQYGVPVLIPATA